VLVLSIPLVYEIGVGNLNALLIAGIVGAWYLVVRGRVVAAGALIAGMTALKLTPVVLAWWLVTQRRWDGVRGFIVAGLAIAAVSVLGAGIRSYSGCCPVMYEGYDEILAEYTYMPPAPPIELTLRRVTLQPGETLAVDAMPDLELLSVESGSLVAIDAASPEKPARRFVIDEGTVEQGNFRPGRIFQSAESEPVTMLLLSIVQQDESTAPPGT
jgi:hypothetical protein